MNDAGPVILLIDLDQVVFDFVGGVNKRLPPDVDPVDDPKTYWYFESFPQDKRGALYNIINRPGFFKSLDIYPWAALTISTLVLDGGFDIYFCTTPLASNPTCMQDKIDAVVKYFGWAWHKRVIMTNDKTLIHGDILIDDKPEIDGAMYPSWQRIVYDHAYNQDIEGPRIYDWQYNHVKTVINQVLETIY